MSEYTEQHASSRLIGAPPGYVGFDQGGLLTESIIKHPHAVLLLDEIEKAHFDMYNILLQVMDYGMLTDNNGRKADFRHVVIVMTTNAGAAMIERNSYGFNQQDHSGDSMEAIKHMFTPEFRNRLDAVVQFKYLEPNVVGKVVDKNIRELQEQLQQHNVKLSLSVPAKRWLVQHGYNRTMGARPLERIIDKEIKQPLADELLFGRLAKTTHQQVYVTVTHGELEIKIRRKEIAVSEKGKIK